MFTEKDFNDYFSGIEHLITGNLVSCTDLLNELTDQAIKSKLSMIMQEDMDDYRFVKDVKQRFGREV